MTPREIELATESWSKLLPISTTTIELFYKHLATTEPNLNPIVLHDIRKQDSKLISILETAIKCLDRPDLLLPILLQMGRRHMGYDIATEYCPAICQAFIWTLKELQNEDFTYEVHEAWLSVFTAIADTISNAPKQSNVA